MSAAERRALIAHAPGNLDHEHLAAVTIGTALDPQ
jgi:hypothetical protein